MNDLWWLTLMTGILAAILAFSEGERLFKKVATLLVFAGIWALVHCITDIFRAFRPARTAD